MVYVCSLWCMCVHYGVCVFIMVYVCSLWCMCVHYGVCVFDKCNAVLFQSLAKSVEDCAGKVCCAHQHIRISVCMYMVNRFL